MKDLDQVKTLKKPSLMKKNIILYIDENQCFFMDPVDNKFP